MWLRIGFVAMIVSLLVVLCLMFGCAGPTSPRNVPDFVQAEFDIAIGRLACVKSSSSLSRFSPEDFFYIRHPDEAIIQGCGVYTLSGRYVFGNFQKPRYIHFADSCERVVRHELGHAILYALGDRYYHCWEHYNFWEEGVERFQDCPMEYLKPCMPHLGASEEKRTPEHHGAL